MRYRALMLAALLAGLTSSGCATRSEDVAAAHVSPPNYNQLNCRQLADTAAGVSKELSTSAVSATTVSTLGR